MKKYQYSEFTTPDKTYHSDMINWMNIKGGQGYRVIKVDVIEYYDSGSRSGTGIYKFLLEKEIE
jgi:hypothetical protein